MEEERDLTDGCPWEDNRSPAREGEVSMWTIRQVVELLLVLLRGIYELVTGAREFRSLEEGLQGLVQRVAGRALVLALEGMDERLMRERDKKRWELIDTRERTVVTAFGEVTIRRRYYRDRETGERVFLLDEALGLAERERFSPKMQELAVAFAVEMPYHRAARLMGKVLPGLSPMAVWQAAQEAGARVREEAESRREAMFERGEDAGGKRVAEVLCLEADGVWVASRREQGEKLELKLAVAYEGKEAVGGRKRLVERRAFAALAEGEAFWEQATAEFGRRWDMGAIGDYVVGGDGAGWVKAGRALFEGARYRLDRYHLRKALVGALAHDERALREVAGAIGSGQWAQTAEVLQAAEARADSRQRKERIRALKRYLEANWDGIAGSEEARGLGGAIEGQVFHHVARRMKRHGARWSERGADHLARLLAVKANGELAAVCQGRRQMQSGRLKELAGDRLIQELRPGEDAGAWLRAKLPALLGPAADEPWVKFCLRPLSRVNGVA